MLKNLLQNLLARIFGKKYDIWTEQVVDCGNDGYFLYDGKIYYGQRFGVFFSSCFNDSGMPLQGTKNSEN